MRFAIGVDLGGTNLRVAAVEESGLLLERVALPVQLLAGREAVVDAISQSTMELAKAYRGKGTLLGVGVGIPGIIYIRTGTLRKSPNLPGWENFRVRDEIESRLGTRVVLDNDANAAALGEQWLGVGKTEESLCLLTLGTGVGGGLIFCRKVWRGFLGMAGEVGHIMVTENGVPCGCGSSGCLETEASASAIARKGEEVIRAGRSPALARAVQERGAVTSELVYQMATQGDTACREVLDSVGRSLGIAIGALVNVLNLPLYVIGGGAAGAWDVFSPALFDELRRRSYIFSEGSTRVEPSTLGGDAGLYGAAALAIFEETRA